MIKSMTVTLACLAMAVCTTSATAQMGGTPADLPGLPKPLLVQTQPDGPLPQVNPDTPRHAGECVTSPVAAPEARWDGVADTWTPRANAQGYGASRDSHTTGKPVTQTSAPLMNMARYVGRVSVCFVTDDGLPRTVQLGGPAREIKSAMTSYCTGVLLPDNQLLLPDFCVLEPRLLQAGFRAARIQVAFGYVGGSGPATAPLVFDVAPQIVQHFPDLTIATLQITMDAQSAMGRHVPLRTEPRPANPAQALNLVHHPLAQPLHVSQSGCVLATDQSQALDGRTTLYHRCDSAAGSSGGLLLVPQSNVLVGLHMGSDPDGRKSATPFGDIVSALGLSNGAALD